MKVIITKKVTVDGEDILPGKDPVEIDAKTGAIWIKLGRAEKVESSVDVDKELANLKEKLEGKDSTKKNGKDDPKKGDSK